MESSNYLKKRIASFGYAFRGIFLIIRTESHAKIHLIATVLAIMIGFILDISGTEWLFISLAITLVWITEILNTGIERLLNLLHPGHHPIVGQIKDMTAGAVLIAAIFALFTGIYIFGPPLFQLLLNL